MFSGTILTITEFIGHFHPVLVHLPIGILLLAIVFHFLSYKKQFEVLKPAVRYSLLLGVLSAFFSCITGLLLSGSGDYDSGIVSKHQWLGIGVTGVSLVTYYLAVKNSAGLKWAILLMGLLVIVTGHLGGTLTHGEGYLTQSSTAGQGSGKTIFKPIADVQQAVVYSDIVQPILQAKCYGCHGPNKQKGKLRLDGPSFIDAGGKSGKAIVAGDISNGELMKRVLLSAENDDHMPPKQKPQLTKSEIELLSWWISSGADYHKKVAELKQTNKVKPYLTSLQSGSKSSATVQTDIPEKSVEKAPDSVLNELKKLDVAISTVAQNSNYLTINFAATDSLTERHLQLLKQLKKQTIRLKMGDVKINDNLFSVIGTFENLTQLHLNGTSTNDKNLVQLKNLQNLQVLNLGSTNVTARGLTSLKDLKNLKQIYLYKPGKTLEGFVLLTQNFPNTKIDTGGYKVEFIASDTVIAKPGKTN